MKYRSFIAMCDECKAYTFHLTPLPEYIAFLCPSCSAPLKALAPHRLREILNTLPEPVCQHVVRTYEAEGLLTPALRLVSDDAESAEIDAEFDDDAEVLAGPWIAADNSATGSEHPDFAAIREAWCGTTWDGERWADVSTGSSIMVHREGHLTAYRPESGAEWAEKWSEWRAVELRETVLSLCHNGMRVGVARSMRQILGLDGLCTLEELVAANGGPLLSPDDLALLEAPAHAPWSDAYPKPPKSKDPQS